MVLRLMFSTISKARNANGFARTYAFGNALGESIKDNMSKSSQQEDVLGKFIEEKEAAQKERENAAWDRHVSRVKAQGGGGSWDDAPLPSVADHYAETYGGEVTQTAARRGANGTKSEQLTLSSVGDPDGVENGIALTRNDADKKSKDAEIARNIAELQALKNGIANLSAAPGLMVDPETGLASFKYTSKQLTTGSGNFPSSSTQSVNQLQAEPQLSYGEPDYDLMSNIAGGTGAVGTAIDYAGTAVGQKKAIDILSNGRAASLHSDRIANIAKSADLSKAMDVVSSTSKSGQAIASVAGYTKVFGPLAVAATFTEIAADYAAAPADQKAETFASSATSAAVGGVTVVAAAKVGAAGGFILTGGNSIGAVAGGLVFGAGAALGYEFGISYKGHQYVPSGSTTVKSTVKNGLLDFNGKKR
jgi:hypothetical protein